MKAATVHYFGKVMAPKIAKSIQQVNQQIAETRQDLTQEVLAKKIPLAQATLYQKQVQTIQKKNSLNEMYTTVNSLKLNGQDVTKPTVQFLLQSLQRTPEWQKIIQQASWLHQSQKK